MIIIKDKTQEREITFINPKSYKAEKYTVLFQNTLTKEVHTLNVLDRGEGIYLKFQLNMNAYQDGEYIVMVFENPEDRVVVVYDVNSLDEFSAYKVFYLADEGEMLTDDDFFITDEDGNRIQVKPIKTDLLKIGTYLRNQTKYRSEQTYIQYNK